LLMLVFKARKMAHRLLLFLIASGLFAGAWWWHTLK
jgi:high-affinity Fe2+/Pb2+ permease